MRQDVDVVHRELYKDRPEFSHNITIQTHTSCTFPSWNVSRWLLIGQDVVPEGWQDKPNITIVSQPSDNILTAIGRSCEEGESTLWNVNSWDSIWFLILLPEHARNSLTKGKRAWGRRQKSDIESQLVGGRVCSFCNVSTLVPRWWKGGREKTEHYREHTPTHHGTFHRLLRQWLAMYWNICRVLATVINN